MAIDYGDVRTGVAVSDITKTLIGDTWVITGKKEKEIVESIINEAFTRTVVCIIVGHPKNMDGTIGPRAEKCERFADLIKNQANNVIEVKLWDERMTTMNAHRILNETGTYGKKRKKSIDAVAASLILESYLNSLK